jgi:hypothetical protein
VPAEPGAAVGLEEGSFGLGGYAVNGARERGETVVFGLSTAAGRRIRKLSGTDTKVVTGH